MSTLLTLGGVGIPPYSARGLTQTLEPIEASVQLRRTVNGALADLSHEPFRKYKSTISCQDQEPPAVDGGLARPGHRGRMRGRALRPNGNRLARASGCDWLRAHQRRIHLLYRPILSMRVTGFSVSRDEYGSTVSWQLQLEEV